MSRKVLNRIVLVLAGMATVLIMIIKFIAPPVDEREAIGIVTSKFTDCVGGTQIDKETGEIVAIQRASCDGASTITLDHVLGFVTATGNVPDGLAYSVDKCSYVFEARSVFGS